MRFLARKSLVFSDVETYMTK